MQICKRDSLGWMSSRTASVRAGGGPRTAPCAKAESRLNASRCPIRMNRDDGEAGLHQRIDEQARGAFNGDRRATPMPEALRQQTQPGLVMGDLHALLDHTVLVDDAHRMGLTGPIQSGITRAHGRTPEKCGITVRAGSPCGTLTDRRSRPLTSAQHPVARLGLPVPQAPRVSCGPSRGQRIWRSSQGHGTQKLPVHSITPARQGRFVTFMEGRVVQ